MPRRSQASNYAGARGRIGLADIAKLGPRYAIQPKIDGCFVTIELDSQGRAAAVRSRTGRAYSERVHMLAGEVLGAPFSVLVGELEAHTEAGRRAAAMNPGGLPHVHLFDLLRVGKIPVGDLPYSHRRDALWRMRAQLMDATDGRNGARDRDGNLHGENGRYRAQIERGWRRAPIVEQRPVSQADQLWSEYVDLAGGEGLVVVDLRAPVGRRGAKRKCKESRTVDVTVLQASARRAVVHWAALGCVFTVGCSGKVLIPGQVWAVTHDGYYDDGTPKFPRLARPRPDLA